MQRYSEVLQQVSDAETDPWKASAQQNPQQADRSPPSLAWSCLEPRGDPRWKSLEASGQPPGVGIPGLRALFSDFLRTALLVTWLFPT